jgi:hypothetical protein
MIECWKFFNYEGKVQIEIYAEDEQTIKKLIQIPRARTSVTYINSNLIFVGMDLIIPSNNFKAVYKILGIKKWQIKFI